MEKVLSVTLMVIALLIGTLLGAVMFSDTEVVETVKTETKEVEVPVEVEKTVEVEKDFSDYLNESVDYYFSDVREDLDKYEEISVIDVDDEFAIRLSEDEQSVYFEVDYRLIDTLRDRRRSESCDVEVVYDLEEDEQEINARC